MSGECGPKQALNEPWALRGSRGPPEHLVPHHALFLEQRPPPPAVISCPLKCKLQKEARSWQQHLLTRSWGSHRAGGDGAGQDQPHRAQRGSPPALCPGEKRIWPGTKRGSLRFHLPLWEVQSGLTKMVISGIRI